MTLRTTAAACVAAAAVLAAPGIAQAKTKTVSMGPPPALAKKLQKIGPVDVNDFFLHRVTIRTGDKVKFKPNGFHNIDLPAKGDDPTPLLAPTGAVATNVTDAAGQPFWFNGQPIVNFNPVLLSSAFGKTLTYNGKKGVQSGLPLGADLKPLTVKFKKKGRYTYYCDVHTGMKGVVRVKGKKARVPSKRADRKRLAKQFARNLKTAKKLTSAKTPANTVDIGVAGKHGEELFAFAPSKLTVPVGTTLKFRMSAGSYEVHTATTGPGDPGAEADSYLREIAKSFEGSPTGIDPRGLYASETPGGAAANLTPALHGNGFWNTGVLDAAASTPQLAGENSVTFGAPGTYDFYCLIHPFMKGTVTVQ